MGVWFAVEATGIRDTEGGEAPSKRRYTTQTSYHSQSVGGGVVLDYDLECDGGPLSDDSGSTTEYRRGGMRWSRAHERKIDQSQAYTAQVHEGGGHSSYRLRRAA